MRGYSKRPRVSWKIEHRVNGWAVIRSELGRSGRIIVQGLATRDEAVERMDELKGSFQP